MNHRGQRALRDGDWKYLRVDGHDYLFNIPADERERANRAAREPAAAGGACAPPGKRGTRPCRRSPRTPRSASAMRPRTCRSASACARPPGGRLLRSPICLPPRHLLDSRHDRCRRTPRRRCRRCGAFAIRTTGRRRRRSARCASGSMRSTRRSSPCSPSVPCACAMPPASSATPSRWPRPSARRRCSPACVRSPPAAPPSFPALPDVVEAAYRVLVAGFIAGEERFFAETEPIPT